MRLSKYFTYNEMIDSDYAKRHKLDNTPNSIELERLKQTAQAMDNVRILLNVPVIVKSGFRSLLVNRGIGSSDNSQHRRGEAVDFVTHKLTPRQIVEMIIESNIQYDQLILEYDAWVHISFSARNRRQVLIIDSKGTRSFK